MVVKSGSAVKSPNFVRVSLCVVCKIIDLTVDKGKDCRDLGVNHRRQATQVEEPRCQTIEDKRDAGGR